MRLVAAALVASLLGGCTMSRTARVTLVATGTALAVGGGVVVAGADDNDPADPDDHGKLITQLVVAAMIAGGLGLAVTGIASHEPPAVERLTFTTTPPPPTRTPGMLPDVAASDEVLHLAKQVRTAVSLGQCAAAWRTETQIERRDPRYARALRASTAMAACPDAR